MSDSEVTRLGDSQPVSYQPARPRNERRAVQDPTRSPVDSQAPTICALQSTDGSVELRPPCIPGYEIISILGRGGVGVVYKARQMETDRVVALKVLRAGSHAGEMELSRFRTEYAAVAKVQHPNVIQIYEVGEHEGVPYLAAEYIDGGDLHKWLAGRVLPVSAAVRLAYTLARAVGEAHRQRIVHRDIKPANILMTASGVPKVADFGLAKQSGESNQTTTGAVLGTPQYMAPEQAAGQTWRIGPTSDVYSLGVILYECLTGRVPLVGESVIDTLDRVRFASPIPIHELRAEVPAELAAIVRRCLDKVPEERYRSADELADELAHFLEGGAESQPGDCPEDTAGSGLPVWVPRIWLPSVVVLSAILLIVALVLGEYGWRDRPAPKSHPESAPAVGSASGVLPTVLP
jgi:serine/threonine protein kinase